MSRKLKTLPLVTLIILLVATIILVGFKLSNNSSTIKNILIIILLIVGIIAVIFNGKANEEDDAININKKKNMISETTEWIYFISISFSIVLIITSFFIFTSKVSGISMEPSLHDGQRVFINVFNYEPEINDLIIYDTKDKEELIVKRVVALEGSVISFVEIEDDFSKMYIAIDGKLYQNPTNELYVVARSDKLFRDLKGKEYILQKDEILLLGDNQAHSWDGRNMGVVKTNNIIGKVIGY